MTQIKGLAGDTREVAVDALAADLEGSVLYPEDEAFAEAILLWNGMIKKRPAVVIRPESTDDVVRTINFVRENELLLSIKGGGHNIAGLALSDGGVTLDMSGLKGVDVDKEAVIQGQVLRGEEPVSGAYVRLLDASGEFTAEVPTSATGHFRFFAAPGEWTLRTLAPKADVVDRKVVAEQGVVAEVSVAI